MPVNNAALAFQFKQPEVGIEDAITQAISNRRQTSLADTVLSGSKEDSQKALIQLAQRNPQMAKLTHGILQSNNQEAQLAYQQAINLTARRALKLQRMDRTQRDREVERMIADTEPNSPEYQELIAFRGMTTEEQDFELQDDVDQAREIENILKARNPVSGNAKLAGSFLTKVDGVNTLQAGVLKNGQLEIQSRPLDGEMAARATGETADETSVRKVIDARGVEGAKQGAVTEALPGQEQIKTEAAVKREERIGKVKERAAIRKEINDKGIGAQRELPKLKRILQGLEFVETGKMAQAKAILGPYLPGVDPTNEQVMLAQLSELVFPVLDNFPGQLSEGERKFATETVARLGNTTEANRLIIQHMIKTFEQAVEERRQFKAFKGDPLDFEFETSDTRNVLSPEQQSEFERLQQEMRELSANG